MIFIYANCKNTEDARKIATGLVNNRIAAGVDIFPIYSIFRDHDAVKGINAATLVIKTEESKIQEAGDAIRAISPEAAPHIISFAPFRINPEVKEWLRACVN
ncbi:MAG: divalent cation tolerance protein CutA [Nanoarchaeota archaeon]|nr:divalent cation tolerance protein CutA [Nanoarchaeota archaeon]